MFARDASPLRYFATVMGFMMDSVVVGGHRTAIQVAKRLRIRPLRSTNLSQNPVATHHLQQAKAGLSLLPLPCQLQVPRLLTAPRVAQAKKYSKATLWAFAATFPLPPNCAQCQARPARHVENQSLICGCQSRPVDGIEVSVLGACCHIGHLPNAATLCQRKPKTGGGG